MARGHGDKDRDANEAQAAWDWSADERTAEWEFALSLRLLTAEVPLSKDDIVKNYLPVRPGAGKNTINKKLRRARQSLAECGLRVRQHRKGDGKPARWELDRSCLASTNPDDRLSEDELVLVRALCGPLLDDPGYLSWRHYLRMALAKIGGDPDAARRAPLPQIRPEEPRANTDIAARIAEAMARDVSVTFDYVDASGSPSHPTVDPLGLFDLRNHSYLAAYRLDEGHEGKRTYRCDRIRAASSIELTERRRRPHPDVTLSSFVKLPFQIGSERTECAFDIRDLSTPDFVDHVYADYESDPAKEGDRAGHVWRTWYADVDDAAAWAVAKGAVPLEPPELVEAWRDVLSLSRTGARTGATRPAPLAGKPKNGGRRGTAQILGVLLATAAQLNDEGARVNASNLVQRFGVSAADAYTYLELVESAAGGSPDVPPTLSLRPHTVPTRQKSSSAGADDDRRVLRTATLEATDDAARPVGMLRLTRLEATALEGALNKAGMPEDDPIRQKLRRAFWPAEGALDAPGISTRAWAFYDTLRDCALATLRRGRFTFFYQGQKDDLPRERHVERPRIRQDGERWLMDACDLDDDDRVKTFWVDMVSVPAQGPRHESESEPTPPDAEDERPPAGEAARGGLESNLAPAIGLTPREVTLEFDDPHLLDLLDWSTVEFVERTSPAAKVVGTVYYAGGDWLLRRIAAGGGTIRTGDSEVMGAVRAYADRRLRLHERGRRR